MMLRSTTNAMLFGCKVPVHRVRLAAPRSTATEQEAAAPAANAPAEPSILRTLDALDSLLPPEPESQQTVASTSQPASSSSSSSNSIAAGSTIPNPLGNIWGSKSSSSNVAANKQSKKGGQTFEQVMGFEGLAPEVINGRAAMLGFVAALINELHGDSVFAQLVAGGGVSALEVILLVTVASFAPAVRQVPFDKMFGKDKDPASFGPFTPTAEILNGRAAMLGLLALLFIEGSSNQPFFL